MKSKLLRGNPFTRKDEVCKDKFKYSSVAVTKFVCKEIWQKNHFTLLQEKESKINYYIPDIRSLFL